MKLIRLSTYLSLCLLLSGCLYGQCIEGPCSLERARILKSIKSYGEHWTKPSMTKESWREDWVVCGGRSNGQYSTNDPPDSDVKMLINSAKRKENELGSCMKKKGYEYQP